MTPYKLEIQWQQDDIYLVTVFTKDNKPMCCWQTKKENIPKELSQYFCLEDC